MRRRTVVSILSAVLTAAVAVAGSGAGAGASPLAKSRIRATLNQIGPQNGGGEPSAAIAPDGTIYVSAPGDAMEFYRSSDQGRTWTQGASPESPAGDTSVNIDPSGAVYESNLNVVDVGGTKSLQADVFKSFDRGDTWPQMGQSTLESDNSTGQPFFVDRQWVDAYIPPGGDTDHAQVYIAYHDFGPSQVWVSASSDGGAHFGLPVDIITSPQAQLASYCNTIPGGLKVVQSGPHAGRIYAVWMAADPFNPLTGCNITQLAAFHQVWAAWSDDQGATWTDQPVFDAGLLHDGSEIFADLTLDNQGNPYVAFTMNIGSEFDTWLEASFDGGATWNGKSDGTGTPYQVNATTGTHYFPAVAAGDPGKVVVAFLETPAVVGSTPYGKPDEPNGDADADWYVAIAQSKNILSGQPTFTEKRLTKNPMHHGDICTLGIFCAVVPGTNRNLLDFIDVAVDASGRFHVAYTDDLNYQDGALVMANQTRGPRVGPGGH